MSEKAGKEEKGATFDMYHFFSRKDVVFAAVLILALLVYLLFHFVMSGKTV